MTAATERKPRKMFTVEGTSAGITAKLLSPAKDALLNAATVLEVLSLAGGMFPKAKAVLDMLDKFNEDPTAKPETT